MEFVHKTGPIAIAKDRANGGSINWVTCPCGFEIKSHDILEIASMAEEHVNPGMGEFARKMLSDDTP